MKNYWSQFFQMMQAFCIWWTGTLFGLLPEKLKDRLHHKGVDTTFLIQGNDIFALRETEDVHLGAIEQSEDGPYIEWGEGVFDNGDILSGDVSLRFSAHWGFWQNIALPRMDISDAARALELQLAQYSPLQVDKIHYAHRFNTGQGETQADLVLVKREKVEAVLKSVLSRGFSVEGVYISPQSEDGVFDIRPDLTARKKKALFLKTLVLAAAPVMAFVISYNVILNRYEGAHQDLDQKIQVARMEAEAIREKRAALLQENKRQELISKLFARPSFPTLIEALSQLAPRGAWVREFRLQNDRVSLIGQSDDLALLVQHLENSDLIHQVDITTSNATAQQGRNDFILELQLKPGGTE